ncbi:possible abortive infection phage resistance protein [hydrothermal vent metagenome]|uniref:Possible abortive infection phage resistance protein n=2 Tax=hydrothermal vent metagenome TaxID=652676 RepID=A0A3B0UUW9_9ZZZZ
MDINKHIIDQRIRKIRDDRPEWFTEDKSEEEKKRNLSKSFLILGIASVLEIDITEAYDCVTEGGGDAGIDGMYIEGTIDYEFTVVLFQSKYHFNLEKAYNFPDNAILRVVNSIGVLFNPKKDVVLNSLIKPKIEEIRSLIMDGYIPTVKCILLNNGKEWQQEGNQHIANAKFPPNQVSFSHYNHEDISKQLQSTKPINESISLNGKSIIEDFDFKRVLVGKVSVAEIGMLMKRHGDSLLEKNIRKYLGLNKNRVNQSIQNTLLNDDRRKDFYFFNNGITMLCSDFSHNALMSENWQLHIKDLQIINGGQTVKTILQVISENPRVDFSNTTVLLRLYEVSTDDTASNTLTTDITIATNSQTPVDLRDLRANDSLQQQLCLAIKDLGFEYLAKKGLGSSSSTSKSIPSSVAAESIYSTWKRKPQLAKFKRRELFGKFYDDVFKDINGAQLIIAVLIYRHCDINRKKTELISKYRHIPYSNYFMAMLCSELILEQQNIQINGLTHVNFKEVRACWENNKVAIYDKANSKINDALDKLYPEGIIDLDPRRLSATFRRGDLLLELEK